MFLETYYKEKRHCLSWRAGIIGLAKDSDRIIDISFDILSLEALFLVPRYADHFADLLYYQYIAVMLTHFRICSLLSLHPYLGTLVRRVVPLQIQESNADNSC